MAPNHDPLAAYRRTPVAPASEPQAAAPADEYTAFGTKGDCYCLEIRSSADVADSPGYNILLTINHDRQMGTHFTLIYSIMIVHVRGTNLRPVVFALQNRRADYIEVFDPRKYEKPKDPNAPIINSIEIRLVETGPPNADRRH